MRTTAIGQARDAFLPRIRATSTDGMKRLDGGVFRRGSDGNYSEEAPALKVRVDPFWIDTTAVTNRQFAIRSRDRLSHPGRDRAGSSRLSGQVCGYGQARLPRLRSAPRTGAAEPAARLVDLLLRR